MRKFLILCLLLAPVWSLAARSYRVEEIPNPQTANRRHYVSNPDGILTPQAVARIDSLCASLRDRGLAQVAVVAVDEIAGGDVFSFAIDLFGKWGVGNSKRNNGLGILLVRDRREVRFVTGGGVEGVLPDATCKRIQLNYMLPNFRTGDYSAGMVAGVEAVATRLEGGELQLAEADRSDELPVWAIFAIVMGFMVVSLLFSMISYLRNKRCPKCRKLTLERRSSIEIQRTNAYRVMEHTYVCSHCGEVVKRQVHSMRDDNITGGRGGGMIMGGGLGRGGGSFGGGSFGGGSFGGGGAGSRW